MSLYPGKSCPHHTRSLSIFPYFHSSPAFVLHGRFHHTFAHRIAGLFGNLRSFSCSTTSDKVPTRTCFLSANCTSLGCGALRSLTTQHLPYFVVDIFSNLLSCTEHFRGYRRSLRPYGFEAIRLKDMAITVAFV